MADSTYLVDVFIAALVTLFTWSSIVTVKLIIHPIFLAFQATLTEESLILMVLTCLTSFCERLLMIKNSVLESFSLRKLHDIHFFTSATQSSIFYTAPSLSSAVQGVYSWVSSAYMCIPHLCFSAILNNGEVYRGKQNGPKTEPCGMPVFRSWGSVLVPFIFTTCCRHVKYECSYAFTSDWIPKELSNLLSNFVWSTVSKAALRSSITSRIHWSLSSDIRMQEVQWDYSYSTTSLTRPLMIPVEAVYFGMWLTYRILNANETVIKLKIWDQEISQVWEVVNLKSFTL